MKRIFLFLFIGLLFTGCKDQLTEDEELNQYVNEWIYENMSMLYYWNTTLPSHKATTQDPSDYFPTLKNKDDRFSAIFDSYEEILNRLNGISSSDVGFEFQLYRESNANENVIGIVLYVKPGTSAKSTGIKRGDIFRKINGSQITISNYSNLLNYFYDTSTSVSITFSDYVSNVFYDKEALSVNKAINYTENPILLDTVYTIQNKKIGYLIYNFFTNDTGNGSLQYDLQLNSVFGNFKDQNISELIVDLRYNSGGMMSSAIRLGSMMVPNLTTGKVFTYTEYNNNYTDYFNSNEFKKDYPGVNPFTDNFVTTISNTSIQNVGNNIQRIYFITGKNTASASEMVINGLKPYLPCILIGDTTVGKNVGSTLVHDEDNVKNQWAFMPIILKYFNKDHLSDFTQGFAPDYYLKDDYTHALGNTNEALLAKAITLITGTQNSPEKIRTDIKEMNLQPIYNKKERGMIARKNAIDAYQKRK